MGTEPRFLSQTVSAKSIATLTAILLFINNNFDGVSVGNNEKKPLESPLIHRYCLFSVVWKFIKNEFGN